VELHTLLPRSIHFQFSFILSPTSSLFIVFIVDYYLSCEYGTTYVAVAVASLNAVIQDIIEQTIPCGIIDSKSKFPHWCFISFRFYIRKKNYFVDVLKRRNATAFADNNSFYLKIVRAAIKSDRFR
jgi:hypothetical protein